MSIQTLADLFLIAAGRSKPDCLLHKVSGKFVPISTAELVERVRGLAKALKDLGVERGDRVALMAENGPHWPTVDFAALAIGAAHVPIYPTLLPEQAAYIVRDSGAKVVFVQGKERLEGLLARRAELPDRRHFVAIDCEPPEGVHGFVDLIERGRGWDQAALEAECRLAKPDDLATLIYTSGTTGNPKGVMLSHGNIASNVVNALRAAGHRRELHGTLLPAARPLLRAHGRLHLLLSRLHHRLRRVGAERWRRTSARSSRTSSFRCRGSTRRCWRGCRRTSPSPRPPSRRSSAGRSASASRRCPGGCARRCRLACWA